jgi:hypothetical protein
MLGSLCAATFDAEVVGAFATGEFAAAGTTFLEAFAAIAEFVIAFDAGFARDPVADVPALPAPALSVDGASEPPR